MFKKQSTGLMKQVKYRMIKKVLELIGVGICLTCTTFCSSNVRIPPSPTWVPKAPMPTARDGSSAVVNGKIYVVGGIYDNKKLEVYDPSADTWETRADIPIGRNGHACVAVNNKVYVIGGGASNGNYYAIVEEYDPSTNQWITKTPMPAAKGYIWAGGVAVNGKIYVFGGYDGPASITNAVFEYNPSTDTWATKHNMPLRNSSMSCAAVNGNIYVIGGSGSGGGSDLNTVVVYNPATDIWSTESPSPMPEAKNYAGVCVLGNRIWVIGGHKYLAGRQDQSSVFIYDTVTDSWTTGIPLPQPTQGPTAQVVNNRIYVIGGYQTNRVWEITP